jgi:hypothetical protein
MLDKRQHPQQGEVYSYACKQMQVWMLKGVGEGGQEGCGVVGLHWQVNRIVKQTNAQWRIRQHRRHAWSSCPARLTGLREALRVD